MNFSVYYDSGTEVHGYFVPDGFSTVPKFHVRTDGSDSVTEIETWIYIEGARAQGAHQTGNVGFILSDDNVPGLSTALRLELSDPETGLIFYRRAQPGEFIAKKILRVETSYVPSTELDISLKPYFQFYEHRIEHYGFETIRQMLEIIHQPSVYVSGRILLKNFRTYIDYNINMKFISLRDPFYELAMRIFIFSRIRKQKFAFVSPRDMTLFNSVIELFDGIAIQDENHLRKAIRSAPKDTLDLLSSPFTQQLVASSPSDPVGLDDVSQALDSLSQFTVFDAGRDAATYTQSIAEAIGLPAEIIKMKPQSEALHKIADILRKISRVEHLLEADLILYHFIQKSEDKARSHL
ncbi:hypothetical protein EPK99_06265 [Neorhizobium lilium]|uniref:Uncharacterized protein n=1 Tax=Neorhizobium lilium TaxID=2503024 RepID=A0A444LH74_9HYPH|nr:hypothetical protein [Neorhizobium lilium]RWX78237.1 hypothetical protein EPK99_06265 [Neorhizobium lilium]